MDRAFVMALCLAVLTAVAAGCATENERRSDPPAPGTDVTGVWIGRSFASCGAFLHERGRCFAIQNISFTLVQEKSSVTGFYRCSYGNAACFNLDELGKVRDAKMGLRLLSMRVMMEDGSDCIFHGVPQGDHMQGGYMCLQGGGIIEQGDWHAQRAY
jgi:hypothetical protein